MDKQTIYTKDPANKKLLVAREFEASLELVWRAWTDSELLDQWWIPEPFKAKTITMNFTEGGYWHFAVSGPEGMEMWGRMDYKKIVVHQYFSVIDCFCDAEGVNNTDYPTIDLKNTFRKTTNGTTVEVEVTFASEADMAKTMETGGLEGFTAAHGNLDKLLVKLTADEIAVTV